MGQRQHGGLRTDLTRAIQSTDQNPEQCDPRTNQVQVGASELGRTRARAASFDGSSSSNAVALVYAVLLLFVSYPSLETTTWTHGSLAREEGTLQPSPPSTLYNPPPRSPIPSPTLSVHHPLDALFACQFCRRHYYPPRRHCRQERDVILSRRRACAMGDLSPPYHGRQETADT